MADTWITRLTTHLDREIAAVDVAVRLAEEACEQLSQSSMEDYAADQDRREAAEKVLATLRQERGRVLDEVGRALQLTALPDLTQVIACAPAETADAIADQVQRLRAGVHRLHRLQEQHTELIRSGLDFIDDIVRRVFRSESPRAYGRGGRRDRLQPRDGSLFNASA